MGLKCIYIVAQGFQHLKELKKCGAVGVRQTKDVTPPPFFLLDNTPQHRIIHSVIINRKTLKKIPRRNCVSRKTN